MKKNLKYLIYLFVFTLLFQFFLIIYNDFTGYSPIKSLPGFFLSWLVAAFLSAIIGFALLSVDLLVIHRLDKLYFWTQHSGRRLLLEVPSIISAGLFLGAVITLISQLLFGYEHDLLAVLITNALITAVINILFVAVIEGVLFYRRHQESNLKAEELEREVIRMRFETLKKQLDPHFLFNSLNVLSALIRRNKDKAEDFIDEFSSIYRYTLEVIDKPVVTVKEELDFARSYLFLQQFRFDEGVTIEIDVPESKLSALLPPLAIQTLLENAFKHNMATAETPLEIKVGAGADYLFVSNRIVPKPLRVQGTGVGLENLSNRYRLISNKLPEICQTEREYRVKLYFVEPE